MAYVARYWRYKQQDAEECDTLEEAVAYLANGWEQSDLSQRDILGPDGSVVLEGDELFRRMMSLLGG